MRLFLSFAPEDAGLAGLIAAYLAGARHEVEPDLALPNGRADATRTPRELIQANRMVVVLSRAYLDSPFRRELDWWLAQPGGEERLTLLRIDDVRPTGALRLIGHTDLAGLRVEKLRKRVVESLVHGPAAPDRRDERGRQTAVPSSTAATHHRLPARNPDFVGRGDTLTGVAEGLRSRSRCVLGSADRLAGVGKSQLAIEYAHRHGAAARAEDRDYDLVVWIDAEHPDLIADQLAQAAVTAGLCDPGLPAADARLALAELLRARHRWLVIFDNAEDVAVAKWFPKGRGHVLVTSRHLVWQNLAFTVEVGVFARTEAVAFLRHVIRRPIAPRDAEGLAAELDDLPLALSQAAGVINETAMSVADYLHSLTSYADRTGPPARSAVAIPVGISLAKLREIDEAALALVRLCAVLAPVGIPFDLFSNAPARALPAALANSISRLATIAKALFRVNVATLAADGLILHHETRAAIIDEMSAEQLAAVRRSAEAVLVAARPDDGRNPRRWPLWQRLMPHLVALEPSTSPNPELHDMTNAALLSLVERGDAESARPYAAAFATALTESFGATYEHTLRAVRVLAECLSATGDHTGALLNDEQVYQVLLKLYGDDDPTTLDAATAVARDLHHLQRYDEARRLNEQVLRIRQQLHGGEHHQSLVSQDQLALNLLALNLPGDALRLNEITWAARRRQLGESHRDTLLSEYHLALSLAEVASWEDARDHLAHVLSALSTFLHSEHPDLVAATQAYDRCLRVIEAPSRHSARPAAQDPRTREPIVRLAEPPVTRTVLSIATEWPSSRGGLSTFNRQLCLALTAAGQRVFCVVDSMTEEDHRQAELGGVTLLATDTTGPLSEQTAQSRLLDLMGANTPDVVLGHSRITGPTAQAVMHAFPEALRAHFIHMAPSEIDVYKPERRDGIHAERHHTELTLGREADLIVAVGPRLFARYELDFHPYRRRVIRLDPGFDSADTSLTEPPPGQSLRRVLFTGRVDDAALKGIDIAAAALGQMVRRQAGLATRIEFMVRGAPFGQTGELRERILEWAGLPSLEVFVEPYVTDTAMLEHEMLTASVVVMPSRAEGFGLAGLEAITHGVPVLISHVSGLAELLRDTAAVDDDTVERMVVRMTNDHAEDVAAWTTSITGVLRFRDDAFRRAAELRDVLAAEFPWAKAAQVLLEGLRGADADRRSRRR
ncbi:FxSxx-COOH system tetratricopeptide repeat protein [Catellatospora tritici]|uniref:FxSxx-COOH system tetratricopeptide repeat protein n=1 Tax=Catellatospora tritici TaxID=2851566 RepID=UPI001C2DBE5F|nr:FxSxx-COOH system tetratricopeptide repeat protein [Catellatospora tritici]MBV1850764.1 glycosyltransferase [Catellatospora tritici]MBV1851017.1 glycosyltransferase [Catellatospora tritici]